jgi:DNA-binding FadR family transcriptional regulator
MLETVLRPKLGDVVSSRLKSDVVGRGLKPGDRLPAENEAAQFAAGRLSLPEVKAHTASHLELRHSRLQRQLKAVSSVPS